MHTVYVTHNSDVIHANTDQQPTTFCAVNIGQFTVPLPLSRRFYARCLLKMERYVLSFTINPSSTSAHSKAMPRHLHVLIIFRVSDKRRSPQATRLIVERKASITSGPSYRTFDRNMPELEELSPKQRASQQAPGLHLIRANERITLARSLCLSPANYMHQWRHCPRLRTGHGIYSEFLYALCYSSICYDLKEVIAYISGS